MKQQLTKLFNGIKLTQEEAKNTLIKIAKGEYNGSQIVAFLSVYMMRSISVEELMGFREALLELSIKIDFSAFNTLDIVGTGGDEKNTFNISTLSSFVVAGAGYKVAKHGNYGVSSSCGSSNVMESLGYRFTNNQDVLKKQLDKAGICFLHAPLFHPAMKNVAPYRKELGLKTFFNMLGPLVNPSFPKNQILGVFNLELFRIYQYLYQNTDKNYKILYSLDGYDEISLTANTKVVDNYGERILSPKDLGFKKFKQEDIFGGNTVSEARDIFKNILEGKGTEAQNSVIIANASMAIKCMDNSKSQEQAVERAKRSLEDGKAEGVLSRVLKI